MATSCVCSYAEFALLLISYMESIIYGISHDYCIIVTYLLLHELDSN